MPLIEAELETISASEREGVEYWLSSVGSISTRISASAEVWRNFSEAEHSPPYARWLGFFSQVQAEGLEIQLSCHPVSVADEMFQRLWSRCAGAVLTSATLSVEKDFRSFQAKSGIPSEMLFSSLSSPFRYKEQAVLSVPFMRTDPSEPDQHTDEIIELIPEVIEKDIGALVLFTSWRQMLRVYDELGERFRERVLIQGEFSKMEILNRHRAVVDSGDPSCIFGLASFAEGVDLPGDYCRHVVIAKIPFSVPDEPVDATLSEWIEEKGGNAFYEVMLPNAAIRVVQAAGRLLRTETDEGTVTILDRRLVSKSYGKAILNSLPPFAREIF